MFFLRVAAFIFVMILCILQTAAANVERDCKNTAFLAWRGANKLAVENCLIEEYELLRNDLGRGDPLDDFISRAGLILVPSDGKTFFVDEEEPGIRFPYLRTESAQFLNDFADVHYAKFKKKLKITSLLRPCWYQNLLYDKRVKREKGWAQLTIAHCNFQDPYRLSAHLTGSAFDISRKDMTEEERWWIEKILDLHMRARMIHYIVEPTSGNYHILVLPSYHGFLHDAPQKKIPPRKILKKKAPR